MTNVTNVYGFYGILVLRRCDAVASAELCFSVIILMGRNFSNRHHKMFKMALMLPDTSKLNLKLKIIDKHLMNFSFFICSALIQTPKSMASVKVFCTKVN